MIFEINKNSNIMKIGNASFSTVIIRYYAMMLMVVLPFLIGLPILAVLALPIFLSALLGIDFNPETEVQVSKTKTKKIDLEEMSLAKNAA